MKSVHLSFEWSHTKHFKAGGASFARTDRRFRMRLSTQWTALSRSQAPRRCLCTLGSRPAACSASFQLQANAFTAARYKAPNFRSMCVAFNGTWFFANRLIWEMIFSGVQRRFAVMKSYSKPALWMADSQLPNSLRAACSNRTETRFERRLLRERCRLRIASRIFRRAHARPRSVQYSFLALLIFLRPLGQSAFYRRNRSLYSSIGCSRS